ncbi:transient receptor potential cation channel subfamily A member 1 isoform X1 [Hydra vulgaris]|uniref:transient receptor potential cation channel subfamily A member 1 isoform X1 n=2 Tax=Hydra vulgaris TaxID=6087 RepID=UPI001F5EDC11|nr:transient receptor potential cation channel subfamily A member 1-like isoform X1 [Hydra vulgaris]
MADNVENPITQISPFNNKNKAEFRGKYNANKSNQLLKIKNGFKTQKNSSMSSISSFLLHQAAIEGSIDQVKFLIKECCYNIEDIDCINLQGCTPLHLASRFNRLKVVKYLLENGSQINKTTEVENNTPLLLAAKYNMTDTAKYLCEHGADVNIKNIHGSTALHLGASKGNEEICNVLIQHGSDINALDCRNCTPLHMAIHGGSETITKLLIENGADIYAKDAEGEAPIHHAAAMNQGELIILLTKGALAIVDEEKWEETQRKYVNLRSDKKDTALHIAAWEGCLDTVKTLVSIGANINICSAAHSTPLHLAAINGDKIMVQYLLEHNAKINVFDHQNMTPTHKACQFGRLDVIKVLIEQGAQIDSKDCDSFTPLMSAVSEGHSDAVEYLLKCGASVAISEMNMKNVLHLAIENGHSSTLKVLLQNGGFSLINSHDMDFKRPIHYAAIHNFESVEILIKESADTEVTDNEEKTPLHIAAEYGNCICLVMLIKNSTRNINCTDEKGQSPLHLAAKNGRVGTTSILIEMGAQISGRDDLNWTPLDYAARNGHSKVVIALIKNGACVNEYDPNRLTPLHHASINGHVKCINILLDHGADISFQNADGKNCLDLALENHHTEACKIFVTHKRWKEVLNHIDNEGYSPMEKLISYAPEIALIVLDKCIEYSKLDENSKGYYIRYDFKYLDSQPENSSKRVYFGPSCMITYKRKNLLSHPLTVQLINYKWSRLGRWIHLISLFIYIFFVGMLTGLLAIDKEREKQEEKNAFQIIIPKVILILSSFEICKEFVQAYLLKKEYFKDFNNYLELILYTSTFIYMLSFINYVTMNIKWTAGVFSILFAWTNLLLYLKRDTFFGVYVVMIIEVLKSLINVIMVFVMIIIAFSLSFFVLFENSSFSSPEWSMVKTIVMTLGETDFNDLFINNNTTVDNSDLPYPEMSYILFTLFLIVCPIVLMNLLVGLAVGNIADVRDSAYIIMLKAQVDILKALESRCPKKLLKKTYHEILTVYPNTVSWKKSFFQSFGISDFNSLKDKQKSRFKWKTNIARNLELEHIEINRLKKKIETIKMLVREHYEITEDIIIALKIDEN